MKDANAGAFWLGRVDTPFSLRGADNEVLGQMRASSVLLREDGTAGTVSQVDLSVQVARATGISAARPDRA